jgi:hypothetical protein
MGSESVGAVAGVGAGAVDALCCVTAGVDAVWAARGTPLPRTSRAAAAVVSVVRMGKILGRNIAAQ